MNSFLNYTHIKLPQPSRPDDVVGLETSAIKISAQPRGRRCYHWGLCAEDQWMSNYNCLNTNRITESFHSHRHQRRKKQTNQQGTVPKQMAKRAHASLQSPPLNSGCVRFRLLLQRDQQAALKQLIQHQKCISKKESRRHLKKKKSPHV